MHALVPHPDTPAVAVTGVKVQLTIGGRRELWLEYGVASAGALLIPEARTPARADGLWKSTCFELFVQPAGAERYFEFNFSPSFQWAAYEFSGYRAGMRDLPSDDPEIALTRPGEYLFLAVEALPALPPAALRIGLSAVIEETDGIRSYWALAHPAGKPDFHHPDCFVLELPPAG